VARTLSKSRFQKGLQCQKALWLSVHRRDLAPPVTEAQQAIFDQGTEVGRMAQGLFPGGTEVTEDHLHAAQALASTRRLLAEGVGILYEPAFQFDGGFARVDILARGDDGQWDLYEVKSTGSLKDQHVTDAAMQAYVVEGTSIPLRSINVVHLDTTYVYPGGDYDPHRLFTIIDVTTRAREFMREIPGVMRELQVMLDSTEPQVRIGMQCSTPYACEFVGYCREFLPERHPVTELPYLKEAVLHTLLDQGILSITDVPDGLPGLSALQEDTVRVVRTGEPMLDVPGLEADLARLRWPVMHLDFETIAPALPLWPGSRPYQTVPFQYSVHIQKEDGCLDHRGYLHGVGDPSVVASGEDPRRALALRLLADLGGGGSVVHYTAYEDRVLQGLAEACPDWAPEIDAVRERLFDLEAVVRRRTRHPEAKGRTSIKYALPAWCPDLTYKELEIADGQTASVRYLRIVRGQASSEEALHTLVELERYCELDTLATARLLEALRLRLTGAVSFG